MVDAGTAIFGLETLLVIGALGCRGTTTRAIGALTAAKPEDSTTPGGLHKAGAQRA